MPHRRKYEGVCVRISVDYNHTYPQYQRESTKGMMKKFPLTFMCFPEWLSELIELSLNAQAHFDKGMAKYEMSDKQYQKLIEEAIRSSRKEDKKK